ncbi:MAG: CcoQ/FixQ family Cbb3-type cytochrome c oxidase assembly chaperone [Burkholderiaceae bacterium]|nr:CcoQ/FixQ family Cbb3-type cytochrome c oxidase assembly chaperone [Burkholderiaceae bacterium]MCD8564687.1 CcoQ/FixQ family Cbb3-type cytochrome c oxidase assembly chaperone [Burkholderiaceae bacterium]
MGMLNAIGTVLAMVVFFGIVWWAFSPGRKKANEEAANLPFELPDEGRPVEQKKNGEGK